MDRDHQTSGINSRENARETFASLLDNLENQIAGNSIGGGSDRPDKDTIEGINTLKMYRLKLKEAITLIENMNDEQWMEHRDGLQNLYEEVDKKVNARTKAV